MKKTAIALIIMIMTSLAGAASAVDTVVAENISVKKDIEVVIDGKPLEMDVAPVIVDDKAMIPMRAIYEALGANVTWIETDRLVVATAGDTIIIMQIENEKMIVNKAGKEKGDPIILDAAPFILNDRTLVPVRAVSEALEVKVSWNADTRTVTIVR